MIHVICIYYFNDIYYCRYMSVIMQLLMMLTFTIFFFFLHFAFYFESILSFISIYNSHSFFYLCILHFDIYITGDIKWMHRYFFHIFCRLCAQFLVHCNVYENLLTAFEDNYQTNVPYLMHASYLEN